MNPMPPTDAQDEDRDAWLREALRHAPDADVAPPALLSLAILREAHAKARSAPAPRKEQRSLGTRLWIWLAQPAVGAGLASVMVGTVVGLMWWDQPLPEDTARREPAPVVAQSPAPAAPAPAVPAQRQDSAADMQAPVHEESRRAESRRDAPLTSTPPARSRDAAAKPAESRAQPQDRQEATTAAAADTLGKAAQRAEAVAPAAPAAAVPPTAMAPTPVAPQAFPAERQSAAAESGSPALMSKRSGNAAEARAVDGRASAPRAWRALRAALNSEAPRWTRQLGDAAPAPVDARLNAWLDELDAAAAARWAPAAGGLAGTPAASPAPTLRLLRDGRVVHTLRLAPDGVRWEQVGAEAAATVVWQAALDEAQAQALRETLDGISR